MSAARDVAPGAASRRLRILITALWYFPEHPSGSSRLAYDEARYLAAAGHEVWLVAMDGATGQPEHVVEDRVHVLRHRRPRFAGIDPTGRHVRAIRRLLRTHLGDHVDVVHGHMLLPTAAAFGLYGARARRCFSLHSPVELEMRAASRGAWIGERVRLETVARIRGRLERRILGSCHLLTCDSRFARRQVDAVHGPRLAHRMRVIAGWVDLERFRPLDDPAAAKSALGWPTDRPVLFCLRRLVPRMGLDRLLDAAARVKASGARFSLMIAGAGALFRALQERLRALDLDSHVEFLGRVPDEILPRMYGAADAFVLPTADLECFGLIALEALACGRPVLATPVGAIPELLAPLELRWMADDASDEGIAALIARFLRGDLPVHPPADLRRYTERRYSSAARLHELTSGVLDGLGAEDPLALFPTPGAGQETGAACSM